MFSRILVPLDGSRFSSTAVKYALEVAARFGARLMLVRVVTPATPHAMSATPEGTLSPIAAETAVQAARLEDRRQADKVARYLQRRARQIARKGHECSYRVLVGDPARSIVNLCHKEDIDLVVMSTRGRSGLRRALAGSVTDVVVREPGVPVLVIRPKTRRRQKK